jgi:phosphoribosylanthranilate isomerase
MVKVKICGITSLEDGLAAAGLGADYLGLNFYPHSARYIPPQCGQAVTEALKVKYPAVKLVGVFVNASLEQILALCDECQLDLAQLHGDEPAAMLSALQGKGFKAFRELPADIDAFKLDAHQPPAALWDAKIKGAYGGTGATGDWQAAQRLAARYPIFLAGGLTPENVALAIEQVRPWGVDTASGVEQAPGKKDLQKMAAFIKTAHAAL